MAVVEGVTALATPVEVGGEGDQLTPMAPPQSPSPGTAGMVTKTIPFSWQITIKDHYGSALGHMPQARHLLLSLWGVKSATDKARLRALERHCVQFKLPFKGLRTRWIKLLEGARDTSVCIGDGPFIWPPGKSIIFCKKKQKRVGLVATPVEQQQCVLQSWHQHLRRDPGLQGGFRRLCNYSHNAKKEIQKQVGKPNN